MKELSKELNIPFSPPDITEEEIAEVADAMRSGWITTGPRTKELEKRLKAYTGADGCVCLNSATASLELALRLFGIGEGDEVIVPAYTYTSSASVVSHVGAKLRLVDVAKGSFLLDIEKIADLINENTKAIIPVDIAGTMPDYDAIRKVVEAKKGLFKPVNKMQEALGRVLILADSAHGLGSMRKMETGMLMSGVCADFTAFSFHAVKNFTTAEGGAIMWKSIDGVADEDIYKQFQLFSLHGQSKDALAKTQLGAWEYDIKGTYYKCNMTDIMAAIGLVQLKRYPDLLARRKEIIAIYEKGLKADDIEILPHVTDEYVSDGHLMIVRLLGKDEKARNELIRKMAEKHIATNVHYKPLPMHTAYKNLGFKIEDFGEAYNMYHNEITLPLHTKLTDEEVEYIIENFNKLR